MADRRREKLILAQLSHTAALLNAAITDGLDKLSDDQCDYLKAALSLSDELLGELSGDGNVDDDTIRSYASDGVCEELHDLVEEDE